MYWEEETAFILLFLSIIGKFNWTNKKREPIANDKQTMNDNIEIMANK